MDHRIYLAGRYSDKELITERATDLARAGHKIVSRWIAEPHPPQTQLSDITTGELVAYANIDITDIHRCDTFLFFSVDPLVPTHRGGRHVEFGYALALGKRIVVFGPKENIFHYIPNEVMHYDRWDSLVAYLDYLKEFYAAH